MREWVAWRGVAWCDVMWRGMGMGMGGFVCWHVVVWMEQAIGAGWQGGLSVGVQMCRMSRSAAVLDWCHKGEWNDLISLHVCKHIRSFQRWYLRRGGSRHADNCSQCLLILRHHQMPHSYTSMTMRLCKYYRRQEPHVATAPPDCQVTMPACRCSVPLL